MEHLHDAAGPDELSCEQLRERHGDYIDGLLPYDEVALVDEHLESCAQCARYDRVVRRGLQLVHDLPEPMPAEDFEQRLQHRIFHLQDGAALSRDRPLAGFGVAAAVSGLIALIAWSPLLFSDRAPTLAGAVDVAEENAASNSLVVPIPSADPLGYVVAGWYPTHSPALLTYGANAPTVFPGPYSPLIVSPPVHGGAVRTISTEYRATE